MLTRIGRLPVCASIVSFVLFLCFQATGIHGGDSGDVVTAAAVHGVPHPPGYPLYTLLGFILRTLIPVSTVAWRVGFLSSIPAALTVGIIVWIVHRLTKNTISALFAGSVLIGNYLFFLYSTTTEVFALYLLFLSALIAVHILLLEKGTFHKLLALCFLYGWSISHHHILVFAFPSTVYVLWRSVSRDKTVWKQLKGKKVILLFLVFISGLLPYAYAYIAAQSGAIINWNYPATLEGLFRLIRRADYGTFVSGGFYGALLSQRFIQLKAYMQLVTLDMYIPGIVIVGLGFVWLWKKYKDVAFMIVLALLCLGPGFYFYASFPLVNRFTVGTYERFLLSSYLLFALVAGCGLQGVFESIHAMLKNIHSKSYVIARLAIFVILVYPISMNGITFWRFWEMRQDRTADYLGQDILDTVTKDGILLLARDTPLFTTQYVRYGAQYRPDVYVLHVSRFDMPEYPTVIAHAFPTLPAIQTNDAESFGTQFLRAVRDSYAVYSNTRTTLDDGWVWIPQGLLYRLTKADEVPSLDELVSQNNAIWSKYHNPWSGILGRYRHLMLSDVVDVYSSSRIEYGKILLKAGRSEEALDQFTEAVELEGDTLKSEALMYQGISYFFLNRCDEALSSLSQAREVSLVDEVEMTLYEGYVYRDCAKDPQKAQELFTIYEASKKKQETQLY